MQPEMKCPLGIAEADALAKWLERLAKSPQLCMVAARDLAAEAREWAERVKPVPVKRRG